MQYQTKWMTNMLKLFTSRRASPIRTFLVAGLLIGILGITFISLQHSAKNADAQPVAFQHSGQARSVSITVSSHIDQQTVTYTLIVHTALHASPISRGIPITFTDNIPVGLSYISANGDDWNLKVSSKVSPSSVTGTYKGSYPIGSGTSLPAVTIKGSINQHASNVLTNSASVNVWGNTDRTHNKAVVSDNIQPILSSLTSNNSSACDNRCGTNDSNLCDSNCNQQISNACDNQCDSSQSTNNAACDNQCDSSQSTHTSVEEKVHIAVRESQSETESVDTSCGCDQQNTGTSSVSTSDVAPSTDPPGKGSITPFPSMPNTGSDPNAKG